MKTIKVPEPLDEILSSLEGNTLDGKLVHLIASDLTRRLQVCSNRTVPFEARYGMEFADFARAWEAGEIPDPFAHESERDYMEWESLVDESAFLRAQLRKVSQTFAALSLMNFLPVHAILDEVRTLASQFLPKGTCEVQEPSFLRPKVRIVLSQDAFIGLFYAPRTMRFDFSLIVAGRRVFGTDNLGGWHCHPAGKPTVHAPIKEPTLGEVFSEMKKVLAEQRILLEETP